VTLRREGALARTGQAQGRGASGSGPHCRKRPGRESAALPRRWSALGSGLRWWALIGTSGVLRHLFYEVVQHVAHLRSGADFSYLHFFMYTILGITMQVQNNPGVAPRACTAVDTASGESLVCNLPGIVQGASPGSYLCVAGAQRETPRLLRSSRSCSSANETPPKARALGPPAALLSPASLSGSYPVNLRLQHCALWLPHRICPLVLSCSQSARHSCGLRRQLRFRRIC
jgi:hypothetical protein